MDTKEERAQLRERILDLKKKLGVLIVAHNYQRPEVQDVADFVGDSLELARKAKESDSQAIVFCGVHFMAENASLVNPSRPVYLAESTAGCPMADMIDVFDLREWKEKHPRAAVVCYVNSAAAVKAESDICCTSANALQVVESLPQDEVLFIPDKNLGHYVSKMTSKRMILYPGFCITHQRLQPEQVRRAREMYPEVPVVVHPECDPEVVAQADTVCSTSQMVRYAGESPARTFLIGTEEGLLHRLRLENPGKTFYLISNSLICPNMKRTRLEAVVSTMEEARNLITISDEVRLGARQALDRMLAL
jgi:quinolinate synthase